MFKVIRSQKPNDWTNQNYRDESVVRVLKQNFYGKCYLCEQKHFGDMNVEHFTPHLGENEALRVEWSNLYYVCSRCNSIKGSRYTNLLDCCNSDHKVDENIGLLAPSIPNGDILVTNECASDSEFYEAAQNTTTLLNQCYNNNNSGTQGVSRANLVEKISDELGYLYKLRFDLKSNFDRLLDGEKEKIIQQIANMIKPNYPFSSFWRTFIKNDPFLQEHLIGYL